MKREALQKMAVDRLEDAKALAQAGRFHMARYLCGYVVELALKSCICERLRLDEYPAKQLERTFKTHKLSDLQLLAGLQDVIDVNNPKGWQLIAEWSPDLRYQEESATSESNVMAIIHALDQEILPWFKERW